MKTPEWEGTVHGDSNRFPVGALGLPVVYKDGYVVNAWGDKEHRRASPLWLRPVGSPGDLRLFSFAFLGDFLPGPNAPEVRLRRRGGPARPLHVTTEDVRTLAQIWIDQLAKPEWEWFPPDSRPTP
ncbi:hypothetical protein BJF79_14515 [Actinomadura sp. CNU-125]|uniref:hypothetical protein n=1 Tax=Actinomadura sp. CNU-125 TaxID=1904961 RepID=UPI000966107B|nr:hypothetical protein [Actinomadura sp. CNU-125]OLT23353.1 hypothetical protein BJF79_14515 [Actinomadura sp. CNU-125]